MIRFSKPLLLAFGLLIYCTGSKADPWHGWTKINILYPGSGAYIFIVEKPLPSISLCDGGKRFSILTSHDNYDAMVSSLLMAYVANKEIWINLNNATPSCSPPINRFQIR